MEWPEYAEGNPVMLHAVRPGRGRPRMNTEHGNRQAFYMQDQNGMLVPAAAPAGQPMYRSSSTSAHRPASVVIHNRIDDHSPVRGRRGSHGSYHGYDYDDYSDYSDHAHRSPRRHRSHSHHHHYSPSRSPSPRYQDPKLAERLKRLEDLEKQEEQKAQRKALEDQKKIDEIEKKEKEKKAREQYEREQLIEAEKKRQKEADEKKRREEWIKEYNREQEEKKKKEEKKKEEEEKAWREKTIKTFREAGYTEESIEKMLKKADKKADKEKGEKHADHGKQLMRPTYIKVHKKYMSTETLDIYELPWEWAEDMEYIVIKRYINEHDQEELFKHTAKLRDKQNRKKIEDTVVELRKDNGRLALVEKRGKSGRSRSRSRSWLFT